MHDKPRNTVQAQLDRMQKPKAEKEHNFDRGIRQPKLFTDEPWPEGV